jgi:hypothetical protein
MSEKKNAVFGIFANRAGVAYTLGSLKDSGFRDTDVSILIPEGVDPEELNNSTSLITQKSTKAPEGAAAGAGSGAVIGGALGWLAGIGAITIPGIGPFLAVGPIVAALAGIGLGGTVGGFAGILIGLGMPEYEAKRYAGRVEKGGILLSVHCDDSDWAKKAVAILEATGAADVSSTAEAALGSKMSASSSSG